MSYTYTGDPVWRSLVELPGAGDRWLAASPGLAMRFLADRTEYLKTLVASPYNGRVNLKKISLAEAHADGSAGDTVFVTGVGTMTWGVTDEYPDLTAYYPLVIKTPNGFWMSTESSLVSGAAADARLAAVYPIGTTGDYLAAPNERGIMYPIDIVDHCCLAVASSHIGHVTEALSTSWKSVASVDVPAGDYGFFRQYGSSGVIYAYATMSVRNEGAALPGGCYIDMRLLFTNRDEVSTEMAGSVIQFPLNEFQHFSELHGFADNTDLDEYDECTILLEFRTSAAATGLIGLYDISLSAEYRLA